LEILKTLYKEPPCDLNIIVGDLEKIINRHVERIYESKKEYRRVLKKTDIII